MAPIAAYDTDTGKPLAVGANYFSTHSQVTIKTATEGVISRVRFWEVNQEEALKLQEQLREQR